MKVLKAGKFIFDPESNEIVTHGWSFDIEGNPKCTANDAMVAVMDYIKNEIIIACDHVFTDCTGTDLLKNEECS